MLQTKPRKQSNTGTNMQQFDKSCHFLITLFAVITLKYSCHELHTKQYKKL